jgi:uncharacterized lipoprotein YmbA
MKKLFLVLSLIVLFSCGSSSPNKSNAKQAARAAILQNLKNPINAKFHHNEIITALEDNIFEYKETINATNSFGGSIKQNAIVKVKWLKGNASEVSSWTVLNIRFD